MRVLVVGGNSGIGAQVVEEILGRQYDALAIVPDPRDLDVTDEHSIVKFVTDYGPFSHIVYSAGKAQLQWAKNVSFADLQEIYSVNVFGFVRLMGEIYYRQNEPFSAVAIVSDAMHNPMRGSLSYCSSKAALAMAIRVMAREWAPKHRVNGVAPSIVQDTPMTQFIDDTVPEFRGWDPEHAATYEASQLPMGRRLLKDEVAQVVCDVLFGPEYLNGTTVDLSGGK